MRIFCERKLETTKAVGQILLLFTLLFVVQTGARADETDPQMQRFLLEEERLSLHAYLMAAKSDIDRSWRRYKPLASDKQLVIMATVDAKGNLSSVFEGRSSDGLDAAVHECLRKVEPNPLPAGTQSLKLFWTFIPDGSVEWTQSDEAHAYYRDVLGYQLSASPQPETEAFTRKPDFCGFITNSIGDGAGTGAADPEAQYLHYVERRIKRAWYPPKDGPENAVVFYIHRNGEISHLRIAYGGEVAIADQASLQAVEHAAPFRPLPADAKDEIEVEFYFGYGPYFSRDPEGPLRFGWARFVRY